MGTNLQGYHLLWPDLPTFSNSSSLRAPPRDVLCGLRLRPKTVAYFVQVIRARYGDGGRQRKQLAGFSIIQSTTNRMKPERLPGRAQSALARRYSRGLG